jgi:phage-related minor tail protein
MATQIDEVTIAVKADTVECRKELDALAQKASTFSSAITSAFKGAVSGGKSFEDVLKSLALRLSTVAFERAFQPLSNLIGGGIDQLSRAFGLAKGGVVAGGQVQKFARGGIAGGPTLFPLGRGLGLLGEAGAEAVLPLARGSDGKLGVRSEAASPLVVNISITTPDAESFRKSEAQVTAMLARAVGRGRRGL